MHPLSWNVYGGHYDNIELLLQHGANVNADFDLKAGDDTIITVLDVNLKFMEGEPSPHQELYEKINALLRKYGAKRYEELQQQDL